MSQIATALQSFSLAGSKEILFSGTATPIRQANGELGLHCSISFAWGIKDESELTITPDANSGELKYDIYRRALSKGKDSWMPHERVPVWRSKKGGPGFFLLEQDGVVMLHLENYEEALIVWWQDPGDLKWYEADDLTRKYAIWSKKCLAWIKRSRVCYGQP